MAEAEAEAEAVAPRDWSATAAKPRKPVANTALHTTPPTPQPQHTPPRHSPPQPIPSIPSQTTDHTPHRPDSPWHKRLNHTPYDVCKKERRREQKRGRERTRPMDRSDAKPFAAQSVDEHQIQEDREKGRTTDVGVGTGHKCEEARTFRVGT